MTRRFVHIIFTFLCLLIAVGVSAQQKVGRWTIFPTIAEKYTNVIETPTKVYFHYGSALFSLSKDDNESYFYNFENKLADTSPITGIWYNYDDNYLAVAYRSGNIDIIYDDGETVNMADIKDAVLASGHGINDIAFGNGRIYVATEFGLVVYDAQKHQVIESGIYNQPIEKVFSMGDHIVIKIGVDIYASPYDMRHNSFDSFTPVCRVWCSDIKKLNDTDLVFTHSTTAVIYRFTLDFDTNATKGANYANATGSNLVAFDGGLAALSGSTIYFFDPATGDASKKDIPQAYQTKPFFVGTGPQSVWFDTPDGITQIDLSADTPAILMQPYKPEGFTMGDASQMVRSADGKKLYVGNYAVSYFHAAGSGDGYHTIARTCVVDEDGTIRNYQPAVISLSKDEAPDFVRVQGEDKTTLMTGGPARMCVDPDDNSILYLPNRQAGLFVLKDAQVYKLFNSFNTPYKKGDWSEDIFEAAIDQDGNLWMAKSYVSQPYWMLPAAKRRDMLNAKASDWVNVPTPSSFKGERDIHAFFCKKSDVNFLFTGAYHSGLLAMDNNGTPSNFSDDSYQHHTAIYDQNGNSVNIIYLTCIDEDHNGNVWIGTGQGLFIIENPADALSTSMRVKRPVVPRNDGTSLGDYLLETECIYMISTDPSNRKWIATENSGLYLVSPDGTEILAHYTSDNSSLPSDCVYSVNADPTSNKVFIGTAAGTVAYDSDSSPAADDYSEVYAYPNPVRPGYTGWITIAGLMDGSLVKIADAAGNVFYQGTSEGGMISWDGCDSAGNRVKAGVYFVLASQNASGNSGAVAKIMIIN